MISARNWPDSRAGKSRVLVLTAAIVGLMGLIPGMPSPFYCLPRCLGGGAYLLMRRQAGGSATAVAPARTGTADAPGGCGSSGYSRLSRIPAISLVDKAQDGGCCANQGRTEEIRARDRLSAAPAYPRQP